MKNSDILQPVRQFLAELFGTTILAMVVGVAGVATSLTIPGYGVLFAPFMIGLVIAVLVYIVGPVSGAHFNPAVTLAQFVFKKVTATQTALYIIAQVLGALLGIQLARQITGGMPIAPSSGTLVTAFCEALGAFIVVFTIMRAVGGKIAAPMSGLVIGGAFAVAIALTLPADSGVLNPAIALGLHAYSFNYLFMPLLGGIAGAGFAVLLDPPPSHS